MTLVVMLITMIEDVVLIVCDVEQNKPGQHDKSSGNFSSYTLPHANKSHNTHM